MIRFPWMRLRYLPHALLVSICLVSWSVLTISLDLGRTTPTSISLRWLLSLVAVTLGIILWTGLFGVLLHKVAPLASMPADRILWPLASLLLAAPTVVAAYSSDEFFHFLFANPIPRALVVWTPVVVMAIWQETELFWAMRLPVAVQSWLSRERAVPLLLFAAFASLYIFSAGGHLYTPDEKEMYQVTESVARGSLATSHGNGVPEIENGTRRWSKYGLVPSLIAAPLYWAASSVGLDPDPPSADFPIPNTAYPLVDLLVNPLVTAATCALLYGVAKSLGFGPVTSIVLVLAYGLGTSAWVYSKTLLGQPVAALLLLASMYFLVRKELPNPPDYGLAGLALGLGMGARFELPLIAFPLVVLLVRPLRRDPKRWLQSAVAFVVLFSIASMATAEWYNWVKTGSILGTGYAEQTSGTDFGRKPYIGVFGILFSSGFGLFTFNPVALLGFLSLLALAITRRVEAIVIGTILLASILLYTVYNYWYGGYTWANRYMILIMPFAVLPAGVLLERPWRTSISVMAVAGAVVLGIAINFLAVLFDWNNGWLDLWAHNASISQIQFDPHFSPIGAHLRLLGSFLSTGAKLDLYIYHKFGTPALAMFVALFCCLFTLAIRAAVMEKAAEATRIDPLIPGSVASGRATEIPGTR